MAYSSPLGRSVPAWLQAMPFGLVFLFFFVLPLALVVLVSFWDYNDYEIVREFTTRSYTETFEGCLAQLPDLCTILKTYASTAKFCSRSRTSWPSTSARSPSR